MPLPVSCIRTLFSLISVSNRLWDKPILQDVSWTTEFGQSWAILGPNGAGKSTLVKVVMGLLPYSGTIKRDERIQDPKKIAHVSFEQQKRLIAREEKKDRYEAYSGHEQHLLTGREVMDPEGEHQEKLARITEQLEIQPLLERPLRFFSNGETRKTLIAGALLSEPELLILDEPYDGLDSTSAEWLSRTLSRLIWEGLTVWLVSHRFEELVPEITHVLCLKSGMVFAQGNRDRVLVPERMGKLYGDDPAEKQHRLDKGKTGASFRKNNFSNPGDSNAGWFAEGTEHDGLTACVIRMRNVNVRYGDKTVLDNFNWEVLRGENWKIVGPNGAGKSTLLSLICGDNLQAYANEIHLFGQRRGSGESVWDIKQRIGMVSSEFQVRYREQISALKVVLSGFFDSIGFFRHASEAQQETARKWLNFLDIAELSDEVFTRLSYGQQRLILIARAMVKSPPLLILDEPCQGLDRANRNRVLALVDQIGGNTATQVLYVTHVEADRLDCIHRELRFHPSVDGFSVFINQ